MPETIVTKRCTKCKKIKSMSEFYKHSRYKDGHRRWCKDCDKQSVLDWRKTERGAILRKKHVSKYRKTQKYKDCYKRWQHSPKGLKFRQAFRDRHRDKILAQKAVCQAVKNGTFPPANNYQCKCGKQAEHWHHHNGYAMEHRFDVVPLCRLCHVYIHKNYLS